ncbi:UNVERIFIED_CONTAM: hypothetical protein GTU68_044138 [Idotea baltica]|nr:hypothetical protein [Idotea baltica]
MMENNPFVQFENWFNEAVASPINEANAMIISTADEHNQPSSRVVLLKGFNEKGFVFYTNYESKKGQNLTQNPQISILFFWDLLERQIRIEGVAEKLSFADSEKYFQSRPKGSQIGAWASPQSMLIKSREVLDNNKQMLEEKFANEEKLPCPKHWGGYIVKPEYFEFWQGRSNRLHDRFIYEADEFDNWEMSRLAP